MSAKKLIFGKSEKNPETNGREDYGNGEVKKKPYIVFDTEEEFMAAVEDEIKKRSETDGKLNDSDETNTENGEHKRQELIEKWKREAEELKAVMPEFDFASAVKNDTFKRALAEGKTVLAAYKEMTQLPKNPVRDELHQNARSPRRGTGEVTLNPAKLSSEDFKKYIENIRNS